MLDPIAFSIFGLDIRWYGITYVIGFVFAYFFVTYFAKDFGFEKKKIEDVFFYTMLFSVLGGRLFYVLVYNPAYYFSNPADIIAVWKGGMSIHGGFIGAFLTLFYFSRKHKMNLYKLTDLFSIPAALGLAFGRLANFVNQELVGKPTDSSFGVVFPLMDEQKRWPSTIFESIKNMATFQVLLFMDFYYKLKPGIITAWFLILYSFGRFFVDFLRAPTVSLGFISVGQLLSLIFGIWGVILLLEISRK